MTSPQDDREELEPDVDDGGASTSPGKEQADKESVPVSPEKGAVRRPRTRESDEGAAPGGAGADSVAAPAGSGAGSTTSEPGPSVSEAGADTVATPAEPQEAEPAGAVEPAGPDTVAAPGEAEPETTAERPVSEPGPSVSEAGADTVATPAEPQEAEAAEVVEPVEPELAEVVEPVESDTVAAPAEAEPETTAEGPVSEPEEAPAAASAGSAGADTVATPAEPQEAEAVEPVEPEPAEVVEPVEPEPAEAEAVELAGPDTVATPAEPQEAEAAEPEPVEPEPAAAPGEAEPAPERAASGPEPDDSTSAPEPETTGSEAVGLGSGETESVVAPVRPRKTAPGSPADTDDGRDAAEDHAGREVSGPETDGGRATVIGTTTAEPETANRIFLADLLARPLPGEEETAPAAESPDGDTEAPAGEDSDIEGPEAEAEESVDLPPSYPPTRRPRPLPIPGREEDSASEARPRRGWLSTIVVVLVVIALSAFIKTHIIQTFEIPSGSMEDTLQTGDQVAVRMYDAHNIHRGDVVVFSDPGGWLNDAKDPTGLQGLVRNGLILTGLLPKNSGHHLIKRVIGVAGDRITADGSGALSVNGVSLDETYIKQGSAPSSVPFDVVVPEGCIWVMGDNRSNSSDSRFHQDDPHGGAVPVQDVVGVATVVAWPVSHWESLDEGEAVFKDVPGDSH